MHQEAFLSAPGFREISGSPMRRSLFLAKGHDRLKLEPDSSCSWFYSSKFGRILYGREFIEVFKFQSGVKIPSSQRETTIGISPTQTTFSSRPFDGLLLNQTVRIDAGESSGYSRVLRLTNKGATRLKLRLLTLHDPTSLNFRRENDPPGEIGVNAFNRGAHVVMDDVGDGTGVRVFGSVPSPAVIYMVKEKTKASDLMAAGELPEQTAGISGAILILTQHDVELAPSASFEIRISSVYNPFKLEEALMEFNALINNEHDRISSAPRTTFASSSPALNFAFSWAQSRLETIEQETDLLDLLYSASAIRTLRPNYLKAYLERIKSSQRRDGFLSHSLDPTRAGFLETSQFLIGVCEILAVQADKKLSRSLQASLKKAANALVSASEGHLVISDPSLPQGWRRRLRGGYPTGIITEVNLAVAKALLDYSVYVGALRKGADPARYREASESLLSGVNEKLRDRENETVIMNLDPHGREHKELTIDTAVAATYHSFDRGTISSLVHRLLDRDFETGYGPRTVPLSNPLYFSGSYGDGQLGGYSTRAALVYALLAYGAGYGGIGSVQLEKVAKLVLSDCEKMGGVPGEFPYWLDPDRKTITSQGSDLVAAARFVDLILRGELGVTVGSSGIELEPAAGSRLKWILGHDFYLGPAGSFFVGREGERTYCATTFQRLRESNALKFEQCERIRSVPAIECLHFFGPTQLVCAGNTSSSETSASVSISVRDGLLAKSLFVGVEELDPATGKWDFLEKVRSSQRLALKLHLDRGSWKMLRLSQIIT